MSGSILDFGQDISNAEPPPPLPKGPYPAEIIGSQVRTSQSGNQYVQIQFRINAESYPADYQDGDPDGTVLSYNRMAWETTKRAAYRWRKFMEHVGGPLSASIDLSTLIGLSATVEVTHQEYDGEQQASIVRILAP